MKKRFWGWALVIFGAMGLIMSVVIYATEGLDNLIDIRAIETYGWTGAIVLVTGFEFIRRYPLHKHQQ